MLTTFAEATSKDLTIKQVKAISLKPTILK